MASIFLNCKKLTFGAFSFITPMKKIFVLCLLLVGLSYSAFSQIKYSKNAVYLEYKGNSSKTFSINYERILFRKSWFRLAGRLGIGGYRFQEPDNSPFTDLRLNKVIPTELVVLLGRNKHFVEGSIGMTFLKEQLTGWVPESTLNGIQTKPPRHVRSVANNYEAILRIGYRYQAQPNKGLMARIGFSRVDNLHEILNRWELGFCMGYAF